MLSTTKKKLTPKEKHQLKLKEKLTEILSVFFLPPSLVSLIIHYYSYETSLFSIPCGVFQHLDADLVNLSRLQLEQPYYYLHENKNIYKTPLTSLELHAENKHQYIIFNAVGNEPAMKTFSLGKSEINNKNTSLVIDLSTIHTSALADYYKKEISTFTAQLNAKARKHEITINRFKLNRYVNTLSFADIVIVDCQYATRIILRTPEAIRTGLEILLKSNLIPDIVKNYLYSFFAASLKPVEFAEAVALISYARHVNGVLLRETMSTALPIIGEFLGGTNQHLDHSLFLETTTFELLSKDKPLDEKQFAARIKPLKSYCGWFFGKRNHAKLGERIIHDLNQLDCKTEGLVKYVVESRTQRQNLDKDFVSALSKLKTL